MQLVTVTETADKDGIMFSDARTVIETTSYVSNYCLYPTVWTLITLKSFALAEHFVHRIIDHVELIFYRLRVGYTRIPLYCNARLSPFV